MSTRSATTALAVGPAPGAPALQHDPAHGVALGEHGVEHALHGRERTADRHHAGMHPRPMPPASRLAIPSSLIRKPSWSASAMSSAETWRMPSMCSEDRSTGRPKARAQDGQLVRGVHAVDVEGRVGLRVAQRLRLREHVGEGEALQAHLGEDVVAGPVEDAGDAADAVGRQPFPQGLDGRDAPATAAS
jgi:hypothetical protein